MLLLIGCKLRCALYTPDLTLESVDSRISPLWLVPFRVSVANVKEGQRRSPVAAIAFA